MRSPMMWRSPWEASSRILIEADALTLLDQFRQCGINTPEAGGILLGYRRDPHLHVVAATTPQPGDHRSRFHFHRADPKHQRVATNRWHASDMTVDYLGEWHTHPEEYPSPSVLDYSEWRKICARRSHPMLFIILGWSGQMWLGVSHGGSIVRSLQVAPETLRGAQAKS